VALAFAVFWGVMFPILSRVVRGETVSVQSPYYNFFAVLFGLPLVLLAAVGPVIAWRRASIGGVVKGFRWPFISAAAACAALVVFGYGSSIPGVVAMSLCLFVAVTVVLELARGTVARRSLDPSLGWASALLGLVGRNRRRYGGYVVHLGVVVGIVAIVGTSAYSTVHERTLGPGQTMRIRDYTLTNLGIRRHANQNNVETRAVLRVTQGGHPIGTLSPGRLFFPAEQRNGNEVAIRTRWNGEDLYVILDGVTSGGAAELKVLINPLVNLLWIGGFILLLGSAIAIWPDPRMARRLVRRYAEEPVQTEQLVS
jgi:cytochrome c-type biogenesis protein CcmF